MVVDLEYRLEYVRAHVKEIHCFGTRTDGMDICIIHGEMVGHKGPPKVNGNHVLEQFA